MVPGRVLVSEYLVIKVLNYCQSRVYQTKKKKGVLDKSSKQVLINVIKFLFIVYIH